MAAKSHGRPRIAGMARSYRGLSACLLGRMHNNKEGGV